MSKILIFHRQPLEYFPPVMNFLKFLDHKELSVEVLSQKNAKNRIDFTTSKVKLFRVSQSNSASRIETLLVELRFAIRGLMMALRLKPEVVVYYESTSVLPVYLYSLFNRKVKIVSINHEYLSKEWYEKTASYSTRFFHSLEKKRIFRLCKVIGQTNEQRKNLFLTDHKNKYNKELMLLPNYPLENWTEPIFKTKDSSERKKLVFVGTSSLKYSYLREMCEFVIANQQSYSLDIFSFNLNNETKVYLNSLKGTAVNFFEQGIDYYDLPKKLVQYDVGLVLYKGLTPNFKYNVPNKVFEYLACGLEVWCSDKLESTKVFSKKYSSYPIKFLDFEKELQDLDYEYKRFEYEHYVDDIFQKLLNRIFS